VGKVMSCSDNDVDGGVMGHGGDCGEPHQGSGHTFSIGAPGPYPVTSIVANLLCCVGPVCHVLRVFRELVPWCPARQGVMGVRLMSNAPFMWASAKSWGVMRERLRRLKVSKHCGSNSSPRFRGGLRWWNKDRR
jgi:hypothetical protein